jgi:putative ABC transport system substrate-binding protein
MRRREFIALLGGVATWPLAARAQQSVMPVIGFLGAVSPDGYSERVRGFRQGLKDTGYVEGENVAIEYRWAENQFDRLPALVANLISRKVAVVVGNHNAALAAKSATITVVTGADPVRDGLVASLNRPGGNLTGVTLLSVELEPKLLELAHELVPGATAMALLVNPTSPFADTLSRHASGSPHSRAATRCSVVPTR